MSEPIRRSMMIESVEPDDMVAKITAAVVAALRPGTPETAAPLLVDGDEMARLAGGVV